MTTVLDTTQCESKTILSGSIELIIDLIPDDFRGRRPLTRLLKGKKTLIRHTSPERMRDRWDEVAGLLNRNLPVGESQWVHEVVNLFWPIYNRIVS